MTLMASSGTAHLTLFSPIPLFTVKAKTGVSLFRKSLQQPEVNIFRQTLEASQVADLVAELSSPTSRLQKLKLYYNGLSFDSLRLIIDAIRTNQFLTHLQYVVEGAPASTWAPSTEPPPHSTLCTWSTDSGIRLLMTKALS